MYGNTIICADGIRRCNRNMIQTYLILAVSHLPSYLLRTGTLWYTTPKKNSQNKIFVTIPFFSHPLSHEVTSYLVHEPHEFRG
jgi:hypothetical protein